MKGLANSFSEKGQCWAPVSPWVAAKEGGDIALDARGKVDTVSLLPFMNMKEVGQGG